MVSHLQTCQRAFVRALLAVAAVLRVEAGVSRDSQPDALRHASGKVFRKASKSPHPEGLQDLRAAKAAWEEEALLHTGSRGRPASKDVNTSYRLQSEAVLLTPVLPRLRSMAQVPCVHPGEIVHLEGETLVCYPGAV